MHRFMVLAASWFAFFFVTVAELQASAEQVASAWGIRPAPSVDELPSNFHRMNLAERNAYHLQRAHDLELDDNGDVKRA